MSMDQELIQSATLVVEKNRNAGRVVALAESCTGGLVAAAITEIAGASDILDRGFVTYSNQAKVDLLDISPATLAAHGAVSGVTARAMALGALNNSGADVAVAVTGIAGPGGGSAEKPVGMVVIARAIRGAEDDISVETHQFDGTSRYEIRRQAALVVLKLLLP